jgi:hypothetical protein
MSGILVRHPPGTVARHGPESWTGMVRNPQITMKNLKLPKGKLLKISILLFIAVAAYFFSSKENAGFYVISMYSNLVNGRELTVGNLNIKVPTGWYIANPNNNPDNNRIFRIPEEKTPSIVAFFEKEDVEKFLRELNQDKGISPNMRIGRHQAYSFLFDKSCAGIQGDCYHSVIMIPDLHLKITISNFFRSQISVVNEVTETVAAAASNG